MQRGPAPVGQLFIGNDSAFHGVVATVFNFGIDGEFLGKLELNDHGLAFHKLQGAEKVDGVNIHFRQDARGRVNFILGNGRSLAIVPQPPDFEADFFDVNGVRFVQQASHTLLG